MTPQDRLLLKSIAALSLAGVIAALGIQHLGHVPVCPLCWYQRWIHGIICGVCLWGIGKKTTPLKALIACYGVGLILGLYHIGLERTWWTFAPLCPSRFPENGMTPEQLYQILTTPLNDTVSCSQVFFRFLSLSLAEWNGLWMLIGTVGLMYWKIYGLPSISIKRR